jgi:diguanylate cyclase (GGDEF)-like protein
MGFITAQNSIKRRLLSVMIISMVIVLLCTVGAQVVVNNIANESANNIHMRNEVLAETSNLRTNLHTANEILTNHLLRPNPDIYSDWGNLTAEIFARMETLKTSDWVSDSNIEPITEKLVSTMSEYNTEVKKLIVLRMNAAEQHPALYYARDTMLPHNHNFLTATNLALEEIKDDKELPNSKDIVTALLDVRYLWSQVISSFRMYVINRLGSFDENSLLVQENDIEVIFKEIFAKLSRLHNLAEAGSTGIQTEASIEEMINVAELWKKDFHFVQGIHAGKNWRMDVVLVDKIIIPLDHAVINLLQEIEQITSQSAEKDVIRLARLGEDIIITLWSLMIAGGLITVFGYLYLSKSVLKPIALVTHALKAEATDGQRVILPEIESIETQNLIEAFTLMRKQVHTRQTALEHQALHDALTGLPNRTLLYDRVQQSISKLQREDGSMVLLMMDLDHFKDINDTLGHQIGDQILEKFSRRLLSTLRDTDTVARLGGDEFAISLPMQDQNHAEVVAEKILATLEKPFHVEGYQLFVGASIGIAVYPEHGDRVDTLLQHADVAMYVSKRSNNGYRIYNPSQDEDNMGRLELSNDLRNALNNEELMVYYQPKLDMKSGLIYGVEALIRWNHRERGFIPPDQIIYIAEHTGLIKQLTHWVLKEAISQCSHWNNHGIHLSVSVNLSTRNLQDPSLFDIVKSNLTTYDFPPESLVLEVTESAMLLEPEHASEVLNRMDALGVCISIDDFGTGFSSLAYLKQLPVDELKIDKSFVMNMDGNENDAVIVRSTIDLAKNLGLKVVAEGVENSDTWDLLSILDCDYAQGFYMSKPLPADKLEKFLETYVTKAAQL